LIVLKTETAGPPRDVRPAHLFRGAAIPQKAEKADGLSLTACRFVLVSIRSRMTSGAGKQEEAFVTTYLRLDIDGVEPEAGTPAADRLVSGAPVFRTWNLEEADGGLYAGIWEATPGKWKIVYDEWEYFHILSGYSIVTADDGETFHLRAGDRLILKPGFKGTWEVIETTRKDYVIRL
jgi:uncharacterized cupin superfamily protein